MRLKNVRQIIGSKLRISGKEEDAIIYQPIKRLLVLVNKIYMLKEGRLTRERILQNQMKLHC